MILETARLCPRKAYLQKEFSSKKNSHYFKGKALREFLSIVELSDSRKDIENNLAIAFGDATDEFLHQFELKAIIRTLVDQIERWLWWERSRKGVIVKRDISGNIDIPNTNPLVSIPAFANLLIDRGDCYEIIKFSTKKPAHSPRGSTVTSDPYQSVDLFLLDKLGQSLNLDKFVKPAIYHLKGKNDKTDYFSMNFDKKKMDNIVTYPNYRDVDQEMYHILANTQLDQDFRADESACTYCSYDFLCNQKLIPREIVQKDAEKKKYEPIQVSKEQEALIFATKGIYRVNAVAGSGKTTIIALRTLAMLEDGVDPSSILMVTFTNKARDEMKLKIEGYFDAFYPGYDFDIDKLHIETFNSWGQAIIEQNFRTLGFSSAPYVLDDLTKRDILVELLEKFSDLPVNYIYPFMNLPYSKGAVLEMAQLIDKLKASDVKTVQDVGELFEEEPNSKWRNRLTDLLDFYNEYNDFLKKINRIDYEDQLRLLKDLTPYHIFEHLPYEHIIIDEFQDSNPNQIEIIEKMVEKNNKIQSLLVVGDVMQAIYGFRNTSPENLIEFGKKIGKVIDIDLTQNYRSQGAVVEMANRILKKESRIPQQMKAYLHRKQTPDIKYYQKSPERMPLMVDQIQNWHYVQHVPLSKMTILGRSKSELLQYQKSLKEVGIDSVLKVPELIRDNPYVKGIFGLAHFLNDTTNLQALAFYAKTIGVDFLDMKTLLILKKELVDTIINAENDDAKLLAFYEKIEAIGQNDYVANYFIDLASEKLTYESMLDFIVKYDLYEVADVFSLKNTDNIEAVTLITVHSAKGLEYPYTIVMTEKFKGTSEEKRLFYVALTRAQEELCIIMKKDNFTLINLIS